MTGEEKFVKKLMENKMTVATAESCTGGLLSATIVNVSGASNVFHEGYVTYANDAKIKILGVEKEVLDTVGAVSEETAAQMALGCAKRAGADIGLSTTGIAGPGGGTEEKPVGLVYIGCCIRGKVLVVRNVFQGDRKNIREQAVEKAIQTALECMG